MIATLPSSIPTCLSPTDPRKSFQRCILSIACGPSRSFLIARLQGIGETQPIRLRARIVHRRYQGRHEKGTDGPGPRGLENSGTAVCPISPPGRLCRLVQFAMLDRQARERSGRREWCEQLIATALAARRDHTCSLGLTDRAARDQFRDAVIGVPSAFAPQSPVRLSLAWVWGAVREAG
jgi:hypothetical protein